MPDGVAAQPYGAFEARGESSRGEDTKRNFTHAKRAPIKWLKDKVSRLRLYNPSISSSKTCSHILFNPCCQTPISDEAARGQFIDLGSVYPRIKVEVEVLQ